MKEETNINKETKSIVIIEKKDLVMDDMEEVRETKHITRTGGLSPDCGPRTMDTKNSGGK
tara:strand:+ start:4394 stop:4573 length:180 start_codon:yes stop_codon:yes gene_type:complete